MRRSFAMTTLPHAGTRSATAVGYGSTKDFVDDGVRNGDHVPQTSTT